MAVAAQNELAVSAVGVPEIAHDVVLKDNPDGRGGIIVQALGAVLPFPQTIVFVAVAEFLEYSVGAAYVHLADGTSAVMATTILVVTFPAPLPAVTTYVAEPTAVGVPVILHVVVFRASPAGSTGATEHVAIAVPVAQLNPMGVIATLTGSDGAVTLKLHDDGTTAAVTVMLSVTFPPAPIILDGTIIKLVTGRAAEGVPVMAQLDAFRERPAGRAGETVHKVTAEPEVQLRAFIVTGVFWM